MHPTQIENRSDLADWMIVRHPACMPSRPKETIHNWMDVLCLFSGIRFQAEFEEEAQLQNNGETALRLYGVTGTVGFAASEDATVAVCVLPGTELTFAQKVKRLPTIHGAVGCGSRVEICTDIGFEHVRRCYDRDFKRVSIILFASATISSLRLFSRLVGLSGSAEAEPAE
jgi:hypothetical protein